MRCRSDVGPHRRSVRSEERIFVRYLAGADWVYDGGMNERSSARIGRGLYFAVGAIVVLGLLGCSTENQPSAASRATAYVSDGSSPFRQVSVRIVRKSAEVTVYPAEVRQTITGFGGAFNEKGWEALLSLSGEQRDEVMQRLFDPSTGLGLRICRVPIGASDYALDRYTDDETPNDYAMKDFSIERDRKLLIPYIRAAMRYQPNLELWGSAWTPPTWMKSNDAYDGGSLRSDPRVYAAYALYLADFLKAYRAEGLPLKMVAVQNEPLVDQHYPSCLWTPEQYLAFVRDYMGPLFEKERLSNAIMLGTFNEIGELPHAIDVLKDPKASSYVAAVGLQWSGVDLIPFIRTLNKRVPLWETETDCGNWPWAPGFDPTRPPNNLAYAGYTWKLMKRYLEAGVSVYDMWNMVLDQHGINMDRVRPWPQNSAIVVDTKTKGVTYTPMYWAFGSFSKFVPAGSRLLKSGGLDSDAVAFEKPDGGFVVVLYNADPRERMIGVRIGDAVYEVPMSGTSFGSLEVAP